MYKENVDQILKGITCTHKKMRYMKCQNCKKSCRVECPDCGLYWMFEDDYPFYHAGGKPIYE